MSMSTTTVELTAVSNFLASFSVMQSTNILTVPMYDRYQAEDATTQRPYLLKSRVILNSLSGAKPFVRLQA